METILKGDLSRLDFDVIVCPANVFARPMGGVCHDIFQAGGPEFEAAVRAQAPLEEGQAVRSGPGSLPCQAVIHTCLPILHNEADKETFKAAVWNALALAYNYMRENHLNRLRVGLPAMGADMHGLSVSGACQLETDTVKELQKAFPDMRDVKITYVTPRQEEYQAYKKVLNP